MVLQKLIGKPDQLLWRFRNVPQQPLLHHACQRPHIKLCQQINFSVGDSVEICDGPLSGFIGIVDEISEDKKKVSVTASLFGRETKVELEPFQVKSLSDKS